MKRNVKALAAVLLVIIAAGVLAAVIIIYTGKDSEREEKKEPGKYMTAEKQDDSSSDPEEKQKPAEEENWKETEPEPEGTELVLYISDRVLEHLGVTKGQISEALAGWVKENGYYTASGAVLEDEVRFRAYDNVYSVYLTLLFPEEASPEEDVIIVMDVFQDRQLISFHK